MRNRSVLAGTGLAALVLGLGLAGPAAASTTQTVEPLVSGGGCTESTNSGYLPGWEIGVCISNRGTTGTVYPDMYVNQMVPEPGCDIIMFTYDDTSGGYLSWDFHECVTGHLQFPPFPATPGHRYSAWVEVERTALTAGFGPSPELYY